MQHRAGGDFSCVACHQRDKGQQHHHKTMKITMCEDNEADERTATSMILISRTHRVTPLRHHTIQSGANTNVN